ncbi:MULTISPECIES: S9 family peptidase [unclassified Myxococcus]|uniref:alpha/beta hydrolase family protein n=1 Tax=unclassified Myxococcus TaxID=2648731 RepID=UPI0020CB9891|nr:MULTISPECIES: hypothetical protein [unclassified Myxococcus]
MGRHHLRDVVGRITTPLLITEPEDEQCWPGQSQALYQALAGEKALARFTRQDGANFHCQPLGRTLTEVRMFDFFAERLGRRVH